MKNRCTLGSLTLSDDTVTHEVCGEGAMVHRNEFESNIVYVSYSTEQLSRAIFGASTRGFKLYFEGLTHI